MQRLRESKWTDRERAVKVAEPILAASDTFDENVVVQAAEILYRTVARKSAEVGPDIHRLIDVLKDLLERVKSAYAGSL